MQSAMSLAVGRRGEYGCTTFIMKCAFIQSKHKKLSYFNGKIEYGHFEHLPEGTMLADEVVLLGKYESCLKV